MKIALSEQTNRKKINARRRGCHTQTLCDLKQEIDETKQCTWLGAPTRPPSNGISTPNTFFSIPSGASLRRHGREKGNKR